MTGNNGRAIVLQDRDRGLLRELATFRVIDREQAKLIAGFKSTTRANTRLLKLTRTGLLKRFFVGTAAGGRKALYSLSPRGAAAVQVPGYAPQRKSDSLLVADLFIEHQLAVNSVILELRCHPIPFPGVTFRRWTYFTKPLSHTVPLIPDAYFELNSPSGIKSVFLEVDRGTESSRIWIKKTQMYLRFAVSGEFTSLFQQQQFRVLVVVPSERRLQSLRATIAKLTEKIFWLRSVDSLNGSFWSPRWWRPTSDRQLPLL